MQPLRQQKLVDQTATLLTGEIHQGRLTGRLPASRNLAALVGVSRPTLLAALRALAAAGLVSREGPRGSYVVASKSEPAGDSPASAPPERRILYLVDAEVAGHQAFDILRRLMMQLPPDDWRVLLRRIHFGHSDFRPRQWQQAIAGYTPDKVVVWSGRPHLAEWLHHAGIPSFFIGGDVGAHPVPQVGMSMTQVLETVVPTLLEAGHRRIWMPLCNRPPGYVERLRHHFDDIFAQHGLPARGRTHLPTSPYRGPDVLIDMFQDAWAKLRPTAVILHDWREFVALSANLRSMNLDIPRDLSVALVSNDPEMEWHRPPLAHFKSPLGRITNACIAWLKSEPCEHPPKSRYFLPEWVPGESIAPPRGE